MFVMKPLWNYLIAIACIGFLVLSSVTVSTNAQYETDNKICGGFFRSIHGTIEFNFDNLTSTTDMQKICMWTVSPTRQYRNFLIRQFIIPNKPCDEYSVTINTFNEWDENVHFSHQYCDSDNKPPETIEGTVMVIVLRVKEVVHYQLPKFFIEYDRISEEDAIDKVRMVQTSYSWGKPTVDPLPYTGAYFMSNSLSTFGFIKANYSNGADYELRLNFLSIKIGPQIECESKDFLMLTELQSNGSLTKLQVYEQNATDTAVIRSGFGYFFIYWGGICGIGGGGGSMMYYYETVRIA